MKSFHHSLTQPIITVVLCWQCVAPRLAGTPADMQPAANSMLTQIGRRHFVTERGLAAVLQDLQEAGLLTEDLVSSRSSIKRARDEEANVVTAYGQFIRRLDIAVDTTRAPSITFTLWLPFVMFAMSALDSEIM